MHAPLFLGRVEPSYRYNRYLRYPALGLNAGVGESVDGNQLVLRTTWSPRYVQPRIKPPPTSTIELNIELLSRPEGFERIKAIANEHRDWTRRRLASINPGAGLAGADEIGPAREASALRYDAAQWEAEARAIQSGVDLLAHSFSHWKQRGPVQDVHSAIFEAWLAMNETMARVAAEKGYSEWRLFQLAFILANLASFASRERELAKDFFDEKRDEAVTLLYFATGGGKSEAFLGLLCFSLFFDRLRGKTRGVTAMLRYPLRLLTLQQAQRTARVLARANAVKFEQQYPGAEFAIGFWVGGSSSPNYLRLPEIRSSIPTISATPAFEEDRYAATAPSYVIARQRWRKLPNCPFCKAPVGLRRMTEQDGPLAHVCTNRDCSSTRLGLRHLPFYIVDEDIYAVAPAVLVGTVDKLALLGHSPHTIRRILGMFGGASWQHRTTQRLLVPTARELRDGIDESEFERLAPTFPGGKQIFHDPFPSLVVQDEAHLLDESLGTFAGLFETLFEAMLDEVARAIPDLVAWRPGGDPRIRRRAKIVAASATVARPERQLQHLYQRAIPAVQFPHPGPDLYESFYASPAEPESPARRLLSRDLVEVRSEHARIYSALLTNGRPHTTTMVSVLAEFHLTISRWMHAVVGSDASVLTTAVREMTENVSTGILQNEHRQALQNASVDQLATLIDLHRIALTYVTNKKGGDQILAAEYSHTSKRHLEMNVALDGFKTELISGSVDQGKVGAVVDEAQRRSEIGAPLEPLSNSLRSIVATSAISHGVDIDELNTMFFAGLPSDIAEYIQASSRVGRTHVGFCILVPTPQRRRDRYVVEVFDSFHRFLERMVQPAAIDRWAENAISRSIPSIFQAYLCGVLPTVDLIRSNGASTGRVSVNSYASDIADLYRRDRASLVDRLFRFSENAIGLRPGFEPPGADYYRNLLKEKLRELLDAVSDKNVGAADLRQFWGAERNSLRRPMTSLRDVDRAGLISYASIGVRQASSEQVATVMRLIQGGFVEAGGPEDVGEEE
ncbi:MAG TPA: helicase-related protein [Steroidobacteraceae bacterium]|nr:helicase-related protein [Steroidobacteraceae bacterium]